MLWIKKRRHIVTFVVGTVYHYTTPINYSLSHLSTDIRHASVRGLNIKGALYCYRLAGYIILLDVLVLLHFLLFQIATDKGCVQVLVLLFVLKYTV